MGQMKAQSRSGGRQVWGTRAGIQSCINALLLQVMLMSRLFTADADKQTGYGKTGAGAAICKKLLPKM